MSDHLTSQRAQHLPQHALASFTLTPQKTTTTLSKPTGFEQQGVAGFESRIRSVSIISVELGFGTVAKFPNVLGCWPATVNTVFEFIRPVKTNGIGVTLE